MEAIKLRRILCPINFSGASQRIIEGASILAAMYGAELRLFHVVCDNIHERDAESLLASMFALTRSLPERTRVSAALAYGNPASEIAQHARLTSADLIVLGTDRRSAPEHVGTTIVADVAAHAPCPVLHVRPHLLPSLSTRVPGFAEILCCADSRRGSNDGDAYAHALARYANARVTRVHVVGDGDDEAESVDADNGDAEKRVVHISVTGSPGPEIVALAEGIHSDLIVMGVVDGISSAPRLGSTTAHVMVHARCPVLLVPPSSGAHIQPNDVRKPR
jgi:universal stress protein A